MTLLINLGALHVSSASGVLNDGRARRLGPWRTPYSCWLGELTTSIDFLTRSQPRVLSMWITLRMTAERMVSVDEKLLAVGLKMNQGFQARLSMRGYREAIVSG